MLNGSQTNRVANCAGHVMSLISPLTHQLLTQQLCGLVQHFGSRQGTCNELYLAGTAPSEVVSARSRRRRSQVGLRSAIQQGRVAVAQWRRWRLPGLCKVAPREPLCAKGVRGSELKSCQPLLHIRA